MVSFNCIFFLEVTALVILWSYKVMKIQEKDIFFCLIPSEDTYSSLGFIKGTFRNISGLIETIWIQMMM